MIDLGKAQVTIEYAKLQELLNDRSAAQVESGNLRTQLMERDQEISKLRAANENLTTGEPTVQPGS